mgnify:CR=1 FL=1
MKETLKIILNLAVKDLKVEFRRPHEISSILAFSLVSILALSFTWGGGVAIRSQIILPTIWVLLYFSSIFIFATSFIREMDQGTIDGLKTLPCSSNLILYGKIIYSTILLTITATVLISSSIIFLNLSISPYILLSELIVLMLGIVGLSLAGSLISALVMFSESKQLLIAFLLFPISLPVLIPCITATVKTTFGFTLLEILPEIEIMMAFMILVALISSLF